MKIEWSTPHPSVTAQVRAGIEAHKATHNARDLFAMIERELSSWEHEMASLPDDGVTYVVEGDDRV